MKLKARSEQYVVGAATSSSYPWETVGGNESIRLSS